MRSLSAKTAQRLFEALYVHHPHAVFVTDRKGKIVAINDAFKTLFGYSKAESIGLTTSDLVEKRDWRFPDISPPRSGQQKIKKFKIEKKLRRKDGSSFWGELNETVIFNDQNKVEATITIAFDISIIKEIQDAVQEQDTFIKAIYNNAAQAISSTDEDGRFIEINPAFMTMFGYTREEVLKLTHLDITHPAYHQKSLEKAAALFRNEIDGYRLEKQYLRKDGSTFWGDLSVTGIQKPNGKIQSVAVIVDISERKKAETALQQNRDELENRVKKRTAELAASHKKLVNEIAYRARIQEGLKESEHRLRTIFETTTVSVFIKDRNLKYTMVNPCMANLFDKSPDELVGLTDEDLFKEDESRHLRQVDNRVLAGETIEEVHSRMINGSLITFSDNRTPMRDASGNIIGVCGISRDITERHNTNSVRDSTDYEFQSAAMHATLVQARTVARTNTIVLLTGESGVGKDHLARYIHMQSPYSAGPYYSINCGAIPSELAESELFGHERGAFSGASRKKRGIFELAEGGTVLLNEIGELPLLLQVKLLTFLDTFTFTRVGGEKKIAVNARILAATNRNLESEVSSGRFRKDLFYRLNIMPIEVPPLRERIEDIPVIASKITTQLAKEFQLPYEPKIRASALKELIRYSWPGNVRELKNAIERAIILSNGQNLNFDFLTQECPDASVDAWTIAFPPVPSLPEVVLELKHEFVRYALAQTSGVKSEAAELLGISRFALLRLLKRLSPNVTKPHAK